MSGPRTRRSAVLTDQRARRWKASAKTITSRRTAPPTSGTAMGMDRSDELIGCIQRVIADRRSPVRIGCAEPGRSASIPARVARRYHWPS